MLLCHPLHAHCAEGDAEPYQFVTEFLTDSPDRNTEPKFPLFPAVLLLIVELRETPVAETPNAYIGTILNYYINHLVLLHIEILLSVMSLCLYPYYTLYFVNVNTFFKIFSKKTTPIQELLNKVQFCCKRTLYINCCMNLYVRLIYGGKQELSTTYTGKIKVPD